MVKIFLCKPYISLMPKAKLSQWVVFNIGYQQIG